MIPPQQALVISLGGAGDGLMATPLLRALRSAWPAAAVDVLVMQGQPARDVFAGNPVVRECLHHDFMGATMLASLTYCRTLRRRRYDVSFTVMPQNRLEYNVITWLIGARRRVGFDFSLRCGALASLLLTDRVPEDTQAHLIENNLRLLREGLGIGIAAAPPLELHLTPAQLEFAKHVFAQQGLDGRRVIGLHPGTGTTKNLAMRRWAPESWAELARLLAADPNVRLLLFGGPDEAPLRETIRRLARLMPEQLMDAPARSILDAAAILKRVDCLVCCDTLLTHLGAAVGTPEVVIMGPTPHTSVYPFGVPHRIVRLGLPCSPCYGYSRQGIRCTNPQRFACLTGITPAKVHEAVTALLAEGR